MTDIELRNKVLYISTSIVNGNYDTKHLQNKLNELIQDVKEHAFKYMLQFSHDKRGNKSSHDQHVKTYTNYAKRSKAKTISTLEDARKEISAVKPNNKYALNVVEKVLTTDFFRLKLQKKMSSEHFTTQNAIMLSEPIFM